tara:strand:+ start:518 stop:820 length:303 start_codon:yes stop_codon:yes gene_type:complete
MKKLNYLLAAFAFLAITTMTSCSKEEDSCHECHVAYMLANGNEVAVDFGEFCGEALEDVEAPGYTVDLPETIVGTDTVPAGTYGNGNMEIHCEDHGDHDH